MKRRCAVASRPMLPRFFDSSSGAGASSAIMGLLAVMSLFEAYSIYNLLKARRLHTHPLCCGDAPGDDALPQGRTEIPFQQRARTSSEQQRASAQRNQREAFLSRVEGQR